MKHFLKTLGKHFVLAIGGSLAHMAGFAVLLVYLFTVVAGASWLFWFFLLGKTRDGHTTIVLCFIAASVLFLVVGYLSNRPKLDG